MASFFENPPFPRGSTLGVTSTNDGTQVEGREFWFPDIDWGYTGSGPKPARSNRYVRCRAVRNAMASSSGSVLLPKRTVNLLSSHNTDGHVSPTGGVLSTARVSSYARRTEEKGYPVDEFLSSNGCAINDICWVVIEGPATVTTAGASLVAVAVGDLVASVTATTAAGTSSSNTLGGRVSQFDGAHTDKGALAVLGVVGRALSARTTDNTLADLLIDVVKTI